MTAVAAEADGAAISRIVSTSAGRLSKPSCRRLHQLGTLRRVDDGDDDDDGATRKRMI